MNRLALFLAVLLAAPAALFSQTTTGDILGTVTDKSGAVVADAKVVVKNLETNITRDVTTSDDGAFRVPPPRPATHAATAADAAASRVPLLPAGTYELQVEKAGFATYLQRPITLRLNQQAQ